MLLLVISGFINGESRPSNEENFLQKVLPEPRGVCASCPPTGKYCIVGRCIKGRCMIGKRKGKCGKKAVEEFVKKEHPEELFFSGSGSNIGCPSMNDIGNTMDYDGKKRFLCAVVYDGFGGEYPINSCNGNSYSVPDGYSIDAGDKKFYSMGSLLIKPGCKMYMFETTTRLEKGTSTTLSGEVLENKYWTQNSKYAPGPRSYVCSCQQELPSCEATDGWETVVTCDNTVNPETADCSYSYDVGTSFSSTVSNSMSISATIGAEISATFEGLFSAGASASKTTSFDWSTSYDFSKTVDKTITVDTTVDSGNTLAIEQAVGYCGGSTFKTNMFRIIEQAVPGPNVTFDEAKISFF